MKNGTDLKTVHIFVILGMIGIFLLLIEAKDVFFPKNYPGESKVLFTEEGDNLFSITESGDSVIILRSDVDRNILCEQTNQVKYFNETLNQRQNDTLKKVLYVLIFISAIATFFGYKTIKDIKDTAQDETKKITALYELAFGTLNKTADITKEAVESAQKTLEIAQEELKTKWNDMIEQFNEREQARNDRTKDEREEARRATTEIEDVFREEGDV